MSAVLQYPPELLLSICAHVYAAGLPPLTRSLDPTALRDYGAPTALPSSMPPANCSEPVVRRTLAHLCLVNRAWYDAAKPWLWRKIEVRLPRSWLALLEEITGCTCNAPIPGASTDADAPKRKESILETLSGPDGSIPPELLSPPASRDPSPRRLRAKSKSPARWKIMRTISDAVQNVMEMNEPGFYVPTLHDSRPGRFVQHIDFNHFRTIGMRRSVEEGMNSRFVTGKRVEALLKVSTEYMEGANIAGLNELFLRGIPSRGRSRPDNDLEEDERERRRDCKDLEAVDFTGCVSAVFVGTLTEFVNTHLLPNDGDSSGSEDEERADARRPRSLMFPGLQRLGLRGVKSIQPHILTPFVLAFPSLTHLDLSATRVTPGLLDALGDSPVRLHSLALARCTRLTGESIRNFLDLSELYLAPCFLSGELTYLDLSSAPITKELPECRPQPKLRSLGLSYIPQLDLKAITTRAGAGWVALEDPPVTSLACTRKSSGRCAPTHLRVIELSIQVLVGLGGVEAGMLTRRSGWVGGELRRELPPDHPFRIEMERYADANGNVSSGVGACEEDGGM
ncbi:hypothetical protein L210DRAFT_3615000 [Boletus edulis BED1]|uniref:F-box domain-containing protein n=1 Tax=Boletus edulis BED1 TaxID=1328754 RepID=A0AAD4G7Q7_BOLED|nr:hypothetical protein L210DRAFT_3615000 [Boletus edulis BED1]